MRCAARQIGYRRAKRCCISGSRSTNFFWPTALACLFGVTDKMSSEHEEHEGLQMSFLDHLDELRRRLIHSALAIAIAFCVCFAVSGYIFEFLEVPVVKQLKKAKRAQQAKYGQPNINDLKEGETAQYTFVQDTAINGVKVPIGATIRVKKITKEDQPQLALELPWAVGQTIVPAETNITSIMKEGEKKITNVDEN